MKCNRWLVFVRVRVPVRVSVGVRVHATVCMVPFF